MGDVIMGFLYIFQLGAVKNGIFYYLFWCYLYMGEMVTGLLERVFWNLYSLQQYPPLTPLTKNIKEIPPTHPHQNPNPTHKLPKNIIIHII